MGLTIEQLKRAQMLLNESAVPVNDRGFFFEGNYITKDTPQVIKDAIAEELGLDD